MFSIFTRLMVYRSLHSLVHLLGSVRHIVDKQPCLVAVRPLAVRPLVAFLRVVPLVAFPLRASLAACPRVVRHLAGPSLVVQAAVVPVRHKPGRSVSLLVSERRMLHRRLVSVPLVVGISAFVVQLSVSGSYASTIASVENLMVAPPMA